MKNVNWSELGKTEKKLSLTAPTRSTTFVMLVICCTIVSRAENITSETVIDINMVLDTSLQYIVTTSPKPFSVSIVLPEENICNLKQYCEGCQFNFAWNTFSAQYPVISGYISKEIRKTHHTLNSFINVILLEDCSMVSTIENLKPTTNRRKDYFVFLASRKTLDTAFENYETLKKLRNKIGIVLETGEVFREPFVYTGKMIKFENIDELISYSEKFPYLGGNLRGRHIRVTTTWLPPWSDIVDGKVDGSFYRVIDSAVKNFNFSVETNMQMTRSYAEKLPNGTWAGMISDIIYQERNFEISVYLGHAIDWYHLLDFVGTLGFADLNFHVANPQTDIKWEAMFYSYQTTAWICIMGLQILVVIVLICFTIATPRYERKEGTFFLAVFIPFALSIEQSVRIPKGFRFICGLWMIFIIVIGTGYKSNLVSYLSFPESNVIPRTYRDLAKMKEYSAVLNNIGIVESEFFKTSQSQVITDIRRKLKYDKDTKQCLEKAFLDRRTACISWYPYSRIIVAKSLTLSLQVEPLICSSEAAVPVSMSLGFVKDSMYVDAFGPISAILFDTGHIDKWEDEIIYLAKKEGKEETSKNKNSRVYQELTRLASTLNSNDVKPLKQENLFIAFAILIIGIMISFIVLTLEIAAKVVSKFTYVVSKFWKKRNSQVIITEKVLQVQVSPS